MPGTTPATPLKPPCTSIGHWLPKDREVIRGWLDTKLQQLKQQGEVELDPTIQNFQKVVNSDPTLRMLSENMFSEIPHTLKYDKDPTGKQQVRDFNTMLALVNLIIKGGPEWYDTNDPPTAMGLIGFPINAILDWPMGTRSGYEFFLSPKVNKCWNEILSTWGSFLASPASQVVLNESSGWLSADARNILATKGNDSKTNYTFEEMYVCDPEEPYYGYSSWDAFFTRQFRRGVRPIPLEADDRNPQPGFDPSSIITNGCESGPLQYVTGVKFQDTFWLKGQPYSLFNMLNGNELAPQFIGGSVYQAFLSALSYHCWHAPVSGTVVSTEVVPGTYYSENYFEGFVNPDGPDPAAANNSQPYISAVATRGIIFIQANNPYIGLMAIVYIGMAEVSSCEFLVKPGDTITKGDQIGKFHFGGSTHCMVFRPETKLKFFDPQPPWTNPDAPNNQLNSPLAIVLSPNTGENGANGQ